MNDRMRFKSFIPGKSHQSLNKLRNLTISKNIKYVYYGLMTHALIFTSCLSLPEEGKT